MLARSLFVMMLMTLAARLSAADGATWYVDDSHNSGTMDGTSWSTAFQYLQDALDASAAGDTIKVAQGTYYPDADTPNTSGGISPDHVAGSRSESFKPKNQVNVWGGFIGWNDANPETRNISSYVTTMSGNIGATGDSDNSFHVLDLSESDQNTQVEGFTITLGNANNTGLVTNKDFGGGIFDQPTTASGAARVEKCIISLNKCREQGGAIYLDDIVSPGLRFDACVINDNSSARYGGGIYNDHGVLVFTNCQITGNDATASTKRGGGIYGDGGSLNLINCELTGNSAKDGGGIYLLKIIAGFRGCVFDGNLAVAGEGGAVSFGHEGAGTVAVNCIFQNNSATGSSGGGGALYFGIHSITQTLINCEFLNNSAQGANGFGGAIRTDGTNPEVIATNCLFAGNTSASASGGAFYSFDGFEGSTLTLTATNCTFSDNEALSGEGGAIYFSDYTSINLSNCIVWGNTDSNGSGSSAQIGYSVNSGTATVTYSDVQGGFTGTGNINAEPCFVDPDAGNYRLVPTSPACDRSDYDVVPADSENVDDDMSTTEKTPDLDKLDRAIDNSEHSNDGVGASPFIDMGAYEVGCEKYGDLNDDDTVDGLDVAPFVKSLLDAPDRTACADINLNGTEDVDDIPCFVNLLLAGVPCLSCQGGGQRGFADCNGNEINDTNDIHDVTSEDCNANGIPDECDVDAEDPDGDEFVSDDANTNGIPDECETDCNDNDVPDDLDISGETSDDVNTNGIPDECEQDCNGNEIPDDWDISEETSADCNTNGVPDDCEVDCNTNGVPDDCDIDAEDPDGNELVSEDCNENGAPDECDLEYGPGLGSSDCNENNIPDECDIAACESDPACADCNANGYPDSCDIAAEISEDADTNGVPDECEEELMMMGGGGGEGEEDLSAAWEAYFEWAATQCWGPTCVDGGAEQFKRMADKKKELGLPVAEPF